MIEKSVPIPGKRFSADSVSLSVLTSDRVDGRRGLRGSPVERFSIVASLPRAESQTQGLQGERLRQPFYTDAVTCVLVAGFRFLFLFGKVFL